MVQNIIVFVIIALAILYSIYSIVKNIRKKDDSACGDCDGCDIKKEINKNTSCKITKDPKNCGCS